MIDLKDPANNFNVHFDLKDGRLFMDTSDDGTHTLIVWSIPIEEFLARLGYER